VTRAGCPVTEKRPASKKKNAAVAMLAIAWRCMIQESGLGRLRPARGMLPAWMREEMKGTKLTKDDFLDRIG
jgi:hypothetical protein